MTRAAVAKVGSTPIDRLAVRIVDRCVVPFVGAGFTYGACHPNGWTSTPDLMPEQLTELKRSLSESAPAEGLARLAEQCSALAGLRKVCEAIRIHQYAELMPEPQHRYLVYLAREGLIGEVVTTNYDCCIENAFSQSLALDKGDKEPWAVVRGLDEYRYNARRHAIPGHLLIYKINGCAAAYAGARTLAEMNRSPSTHSAWEAAADRIVLTERQLQTFRREGWARDLLQDRLRTRNLFFSGFGSEEPQVRHTALALIDEFSTATASVRSEEIMEHTNAPFIHVYGPLTFYQEQIMRAFVDAHIPNATPFDHATHIRENTITPAEGKSLPAGSMMHALFCRVFEMLMSKELSPDQALAQWLRENTPHFRLWLDHLKRHLSTASEPSDIGADQPPSSQQGRSGFIALRPLLTPTVEDGGFPLPLYRNLWAICHPSQPLPNDWYLPLREDSLLIGVVLLMLSTIGLQHNAPSPFGLKGFVGDDDGCVVHLISENGMHELISKRDDETATRLLRLIVIPSARGFSTRGAWRRLNPGRGGRLPVLRVGTWVAIAANDLVRSAVRPEHTQAVLKNCFAEVRPDRKARLRVLYRSGAAA